MDSDDTVENVPFDEIRVGDSASMTRKLSRDDVALFAALSGDINPTHGGGLGVPTAHSMIAGALASAVLGTKLPGPGTVYAGQSMRFHKRIAAGDTLAIRVSVKEKIPATGAVVLDCECTDETGAKVMTGLAEVVAPTKKFKGKLAELPGVRLRRHEQYDKLIERCRGLPPITTAVAYPCEESALTGVVDAAKEGIIKPVLVGPAAEMRSLAGKLGLDLAACDILDVASSHAAAEKAVELVRLGKAELLMKGSLHTDEIMGAVVRRETGIRTARRISHCFVLDVPNYPKPLIVTDAAVNIFPTLEDKVDIVRNAIDFARALGRATPRVAILSAVETINPKIQSTLDAAALCKMADRGQITGGVLDGPLAFDNAISEAAAKIKGITSPVAGQADILLVPDLEAGNMLAKNMSFLADADAAGIVLGAKVPVILTSRADSVRARMASCAVAALYAHAQRTSVPLAAE
jgi:phosphotransacetylase/acyl dehydratase